MKILLYSPSMDMRRRLGMDIITAGHRVEPTGLLDDAAYFLADDMVSVAVIDCGEGRRLPGEIGRIDPRPPVLALCASRNQIASCLDSGADDALASPFDKSELMARIRSLTRRSLGITEPVIKAGRLSYDPVERTATADGKELKLTRMELAFIEAMMMKAGRTVSREALLSAAYNHSIDEPDAPVVNVIVCRLRRKIEEATGGDGIIRTIWGTGYRIDKATAREAA